MSHMQMFPGLESRRTKPSGNKIRLNNVDVAIQSSKSSRVCFDKINVIVEYSLASTQNNYGCITVIYEPCNIIINNTRDFISAECITIFDLHN
jgi:hypothetical protein